MQSSCSKQLFLEFWCQQVALVSLLCISMSTNWTIHSYKSFLHLAILLRNMITTSGLRLLYYGNLCKLVALNNSSQNYDATSGISELCYEYGCLQITFDNSNINSYSCFLQSTILPRNMIPTSGIRQLHYGN